MERQGEATNATMLKMLLEVSCKIKKVTRMEHLCVFGSSVKMLYKRNVQLFFPFSLSIEGAP